MTEGPARNRPGRCRGRHRFRPAALVLIVGMFFAHLGAAADVLPYTIRPGDTLISIAREYLVEPQRWPELKRLNRIRNEHRLVPGSTLRIPLALLRQSPTQAVVLQVGGEVTVGGRAPQVGDVLVDGATIRTGDQGSIALRLHDGAIVSVQPRTQAHVQQLRVYDKTGAADSVLRVEQGRIESSVPEQTRPGARFEIRTPRAAAAVRGTQYRVADTQGNSLAEVLEGSVDIAGASGALRVETGFGVRVGPEGRPGQPVALLPAPVTAQLPRLQERPVVRFRVPPVAGADRYRAQVSDEPAFRTVRQDGVFATPDLRFTGLPDGDYVLRVRAIDGLGLEGVDATHAFRLKARPEPPFPAQPVDRGKVRGEQVEFRWSGAAEADTYVLQVGSDPGFDRIELEAAGLRNLRHAPEQRFPPARYVWRIASVRTDGDRGPWSDPQSFEVFPAPALPDPPALGEADITFRWRAEPGQRFLFQLARDPQFAQIVHETQLDAPAFTTPRPEPGTYYMRVQATDADGFVGPFTATQRFDVPPSPPSAWPLLLPLLLLLL
ncbi:MAG: FecR domain-containing protein [Burkholderiales bacterium]